eukprot:GCRY01001990.1.p1 GENE.GCRY01001990.1~~GCRY01001990.1.p1  ORF type:complete len:474 (-),score=102.52 GCRY01001990.1:161-1582(-)
MNTESSRIWSLGSFLLLFLVALPIWWQFSVVSRADIPIPSAHFFEQVKGAQFRVNVAVCNVETKYLTAFFDGITDVNNLVFEKHFVEENADFELLMQQQFSSTATFSIMLTSSVSAKRYEKLFQNNIWRFHLDSLEDVEFSIKQFHTLLHEERFALTSLFDPEYALYLTVLHSLPNTSASSAVSQMIHHTFEALLEPLQAVVPVHLHTQVEPYGSFSEYAESQIRVQKDGTGVVPLRTASRLVEPKLLDSHHTPHPRGQRVVHAVVLVPAEDRPLRIQLQENNKHELVTEFTIPQFGPVVIANINKLSLEHLLPPLRLLVPPLMNTFTMGLSLSPHNEDYGALLPRLARVRVRSAFLAAEDTYRKLIEVLDGNDKIPFPQTVADELRLAFRLLEDAKAAAFGGDMMRGARIAAEGVSTLTAVLFSPLLVAELYLPEEYQLAVFLPLFLPLTATVIGGLITEVRRQRRKKSKTA